MPEQLVLVADGRIVAHSLRRAVTWRARVRGLIGDRALAPHEALLLEPAKQIHTVGMRMPMDVIFCDRDLRVLHVVRSMPPRRVTRWVRDSRCVIELGEGAARYVEVGDRLIVSRAGDSSGRST